MDPVDTKEAEAPEIIEVPRAEPEKLSAVDILKRTDDAPKEPAKTANDAELAELKKVDLDDIKDPQARAFAERRIKELEAGVNKKFEEIAKTRKELEAKLAESNQPWSPQRIQQLLKDQNFVSSVQELQRSSAPQEWDGSAEEWSELSPEDKRAFEALRRDNLETRQKLDQMLASQEAVKQDEQIKQKFSDYDPKVVDELQRGLLDGTIQATREDLWKVANFESAVERAYRLGLQDKAQGIDSKLNATNNLSQLNVSTTNEVPEEVKAQGISAILKYRLAQMKK